MNADQRRALAQLQDLTNGVENDVAIDVLSSVEWDVQRAANLLYDAGSAPSKPGPNLSASSSVSIGGMAVDDSQQNLPAYDSGGPRSLVNIWGLTPRLVSVLSVFSFPLHILSSIFRFIFGVLRLPLPALGLPNLTFRYPSRRRRSTQRGGLDRWLRELEEETGATCVSRARTSRSTVVSGTDPGPSTLTSRHVIPDAFHKDGRKLLPDFTLCSYEEFLRTCQKEAKIGCIVLVSEEHDDVVEFKRSTLTDPKFVKVLSQNNVLVWGGDVCDEEAWSAAEKLQATTFPFIAFVSLQPARNFSLSSPRPSINPPTLTVLSRHQGRCTPSSSPTSAASLVEHLERQLLPRVNTFLEEIRQQQQELERDRRLREQQDRAFQDAARRDKERIEARIREDEAAAEQSRRAEEEQRIAAQTRQTEAEDRVKRESNRLAWRRWMRKAIVGPDLDKPAETVRITLRLPDNKRVVHHFASAATLTFLYSFVGAQLIPPQFSSSDDPTAAPEGNFQGEAAIDQQISLYRKPAEEWWGFKLVSAYPRKEIQWHAGTRLAELDCLKGGGQVVVELLNDSGTSDQHEGDEDDGYSSESSES